MYARPWDEPTNDTYTLVFASEATPARFAAALPRLRRLKLHEPYLRLPEIEAIGTHPALQALVVNMRLDEEGEEEARRQRRG